MFKFSLIISGNEQLKQNNKINALNSRSPETCIEENMCTVPPYFLTPSTKFTYFCLVAMSAFL